MDSIPAQGKGRVDDHECTQLHHQIIKHPRKTHLKSVSTCCGISHIKTAIYEDLTQPQMGHMTKKGCAQKRNIGWRFQVYACILLLLFIYYYYYFVCSPPARWGSLDCNKGPSPSPLSSSPNHSCLPPSSGCGPRLDPNTCRRECQPKCQIECQKKCHNRCQAECQKECQNRCQIECQESMSDRISDYMPERMSEYTCYVYAIHTFRWYVRNYAGRNILQGGDDCCTIFGMLIPIDGCIFLRSWLNHV